MLFGQPVTEIPQDLFIPPDALQVVLQSFEGPLDLLLYLIRKQNIDVLDIPMLTVTEQYLSYIHQMQQHELDLTAEYLLMAAVLIEIKTRLLLPAPPASEEEVADPRAELVRRLLAYEQMKLAATGLDALPRAGRDFGWAWLPVELVAVTQPPHVQVADLTRAWLAILARSQHNRSHNVVKETLSVRAQMTVVLRFLQTRQHCYFTELFKHDDSMALVVTTFIALLELAKEGLVFITQHSTGDPISIQTAGIESGNNQELINKPAF
ncbi:segregation/condensation protein A [Snodgrassella alvi]|uniref:segregation and condensation protein A n=1 Tax=Snodgrassella alvi TaxID=1196083 RepID=UPI000A0503A6|nr:ScpA family protein [Snodgrassella alvi]ORF01517.1 segregation/condensation protein A [Snodgrassella alvi]ORF08773.1 segregation/condensation protein A [Snodgrassella alvi]ORF12899.1 segregation/condensation protein A [Snodgrassella alvi]ORF13446.1 segregation/condensation protein A [Snodgrassella alvi]ORF19356.1 segregation/condensation protein A [Snodgrassella alvi]